jgi:hypothetical protein
METFDLNSFPLVVLLAALLIIGTTMLLVEGLSRRQARQARRVQQRELPPDES